MSLVEIAESNELSQSELSKIENGKRARPNIRALDALINHTGVKIESLFDMIENGELEVNERQLNSLIELFEYKNIGKNKINKDNPGFYLMKKRLKRLSLMATSEELRYAESLKCENVYTIKQVNNSNLNEIVFKIKADMLDFFYDNKVIFDVYNKKSFRIVLILDKLDSKDRRLAIYGIKRRLENYEDYIAIETINLEETKEDKKC